MIETSETALFWVFQALLGLGCLTLLMATAVGLLILKAFRSGQISAAKGNGVFCGHCGCELLDDPTRAIAMADKTVLVYTCGRCKSETFLPKSL